MPSSLPSLKSCLVAWSPRIPSLAIFVFLSLSPFDGDLGLQRTEGAYDNSDTVELRMFIR